MQTSREPTIHTTLNLSRRLIKEAKQLYAGKTKTEIIHEALGTLIRRKKLQDHLKKWKGRGSFVTYE